MKWSDARKDLLSRMSRRERFVYHVSYWFESKWLGLKIWLSGWQMCPKESMGYNCRHRIMSNGKKECGN